MFKWGTAANDQSTSRYNPYKLAEQHRVSPMQFEWIALNQRGRSQCWRDVELIFEKKVWRHSDAIFLSKLYNRYFDQHF